MLNWKGILTTVAVVGLIASAAGATSLAVPNYSFESPDLADGANNKSVPPNSNVTSWTNLQSPSASANNHIGVWDPAGAGVTGMTGEQHARGYMTQLPTSQWMKLTSAVLGQTLGGYVYTVSTDFYNPQTTWNVAGELQLFVGGSKADYTTLSTSNVSSSSFGTVSTAGYLAGASGQDIHVQILFQTPAGSPLKLDVDNVRVDYAPSPADLTIKKFFDCNGDDTYNGEDKYLANWQFNVSNVAHGGSYNQNHTTDANGEINLTGLDAGDYDVTETPKGTGWLLTAGTNPRTVAVTAGSLVTTSFANQLPGDANQDEKVNLADFTVLKANFGENPAAWTDGNFNDDMIANLADFTILKAHFGEGAPSAGGVPEPASAMLLLTISLALLRRKRGK